MNKLRPWLFILVLFCSLSTPLFAENTVEFSKDWSFSWVFKADTI